MKQHHSNSEYNGSEAKQPSVGQYEIDIRVYLDALFDGKYKILQIGLSVIVMTVLYLILATPVYTSNVLMQVMEKASTSSVMGEISDAMVTRFSAVETEMAIIKSRRILGSTVEQLKLDIKIEPKTFPVIGKLLERRRMKSQGAPVQMLSGWGGGEQRWGDSEIVIDSLEVGSRYNDKILTLISTGEGKYKLFGPGGSLLLEGRTGKQYVVNQSRSKERQSPDKIDLLISKLKVDPGAKFYITKKTLPRIIEDLSKELTIMEEGKESSILSMSMEGEDPRHIANILNAIVENYFAYNVGKKSSEIQHMIDFVQKETSTMKQRLERAETALVEYLFSHNSAGLSAEITKLINRQASVESQVTDLEIQRVGLESKYTKNHPVILSINRKIHLLESEKTDIDARLKLLPEEERERETLSRDVEAAKQLYILLQGKEQELGVALSGVTNSFQLIDSAQVSTTPIRPKRLLVIGKGIILGLFLGLFYVIGRRAMHFEIEDPDVMERELNIPDQGIQSDK